MTDNYRTVCPIPHLGFCVYERCNFWDEEKQECSGLCLGEYSPLAETSSPPGDWPCTIHWTEDND
jgi:hypothetical protein